MEIKSTITANGESDVFTPAQRGRHLIIIGAESDNDFDSGTVTLKQHGITLKDTGGNNIAATQPSRFLVDELTDDVPVTATTASVASAADIDVAVYKLDPNA